jgi:hypothetical protein
MHRETGTRHQRAASQMTKWNLAAMGQVGLTGKPRATARSAAYWTGRPEAQILSLIGAGFLAISLLDFLRQVDAVIAAGRTSTTAKDDEGKTTTRREP